MRRIAIILASSPCSVCLICDSVQMIYSLPSAILQLLIWPADLLVNDHIIIVVEENKDYGRIIGNSAAPYINNVLKKEGAYFTQMYGEEHLNQGNFWLFSGDSQTIGFTDPIPSEKIILTMLSGVRILASN
jgi:hypothetical protein